MRPSPFSKLATSSTALLGVACVAFDMIAKHNGWAVDSNLLLALVGAYGAKELGANVARGSESAANVLADAALVAPPRPRRRE